MSLLTRIRATCTELGRLNGALYLLDRALGAASFGKVRFFRYYIVAQPVPQQQAAMRPSAKLTVERLAAGDPRIADFPRPAPVIAKRIADGATCFVARAEGDFAGFLWLARGHYDEDEVRCRYLLTDPRQCAWDYDVSVEPRYRLGRCFARLWEAANRHLAADGVRWSYSRISAFNAGSLASHRRLGIRVMTSANFLRLGPVQLAWFGGAPWVHLSLSAARAPVLPLAAPRHDGDEAVCLGASPRAPLN